MFWAQDMSKRGRKTVALILGSVAMMSCAKAGGKAPALPEAARAAGYSQLTFSVSRFDGKSLDGGSTYAPGYKFYPYNYFFQKPRYRNEVHDGVLSASGGNASVTTAACANKACDQFVGTAFSGGGYFEAEVAYDPAKVDTSNGWPAVWMLPLESVMIMPAWQWEGQPSGLRHGVEVDILEHQFRDRGRFSSAMHDWYGFYDKSCPGMHFCRFTQSRAFDAPAGHDYREFHKIAALWVPATDAKPGSMTFYYDGKSLGSPITWNKYEAKATKPPVTAASKWAMGALDQQHMALIIGAGESTPIRVRAVRVWQKSASLNWVR